MALEDGDYGGAFSTNPYVDPAMGRIFAENPEALIPHLVQAGITPEQFQQSLAANFNTRFDGATANDANSVIPNPGVVGNQSIYAPTAASSVRAPSPDAPLVVPGGEGIPSYQAPPAPPGTPNLAQRIEAWGTTQVPGAGGGALPPKKIPTEPIKAPDRIAPSQPGPVPPEARGGPVAEETTPGPTMVPYTVAPGAPGVEPEAGGGSAALPPRDPRKPAPAEETDKEKAAKAALGAFAGLRAPPAPPQPQLRPFAGERPGTIPQSNLVQLLAQAIAGSPSQLRLGQAIGGR